MSVPGTLSVSDDGGMAYTTACGVLINVTVQPRRGGGYALRVHAEGDVPLVVVTDHRDRSLEITVRRGT
jgi:hypothetical protein